MKKICLSILLITAALSLFGQQQQQSSSQSSQQEVKKYKLMEFRNANINSVMNYISDISGLTIITHPDLKGNVTIINKEDLTLDQVIDILYSTLRDLGFTIKRQGNVITIIPLSQEQLQTEIRTDDNISNIPDGAQIITYIITLKYVKADSIINNIKPFMSKYGNVSVNSKMNKVILTDAASNVKKVFQIIQELDKQGSVQGMETEIIYLKHISVDKMEGIVLNGFYDLKIIDTANPALQKISPRSDVQKEPTLRLIKFTEANAFIAIGNKDEIASVKNFISKVDIEVTVASNNLKMEIIPLNFLTPKKMIDMINQIFTFQNSTANNQDSWRQKASGQSQTIPLSSDSRILEFTERNALVFIGTEDDFKKIKDVVDILDKDSRGNKDNTVYKAGENTTKVFYLQNQKVNDIAQLLKSLYPSISADKQILFYSYDAINCIIINAPGEKMNEIVSMMQELDKKRSQVLIKVLIAEVTFSDQSQMGIDWSKVANLPDMVRNLAPELKPPLSVAQEFGTAATSGITIQSAGLNFILNALQTLGSVNVLSTPHILTLDNKQAVINIGKKVAFVSESVSISGADQNQITTSKKVDYRDVGLKLTVTPQINDEKTVTMDINQTINDVEPSGNADYPNIITREITSSIMVGDNQTAVLGGLMSTQKTVDTKQVPLLGSIPFLGALFKYELTKTEKTELVLFITPYVIMSPQDINEVRDAIVKKTPSLTLEQMNEITNGMNLNNTNKGITNGVR